MSSLKENLQYFDKILDGTNCKLIAVSKTKPIELLQEAYDLGVRVFGENKVQEMATKYEALPKDIEWHMIGHLQRNKVKYIAPFVSLIHSIDSIRLLQEVDKRAAQNDRVINCLLQIHIAEEESKFGLDEQELQALLTSDEFKSMNNICIKGVMGMATNTDNNEQVRKEFASLRKIFDTMKKDYNGDNLDLQEVSMGMSGDYQIAVEEGSTMIRVGSSIFGARNYS
ncbi:YggS family pyridoxal phosphate-dependent enzyme [Limibacter armeniacum]|uniref:YggS family pyridoxal phosphate-dependent enzyme n=1 Tax=Limibacter armeniacum TaxID=466084 RepID=UPI002FE5A52F